MIDRKDDTIAASKNMSITPASAREHGSILTSCVADYYCLYQSAVRYSRLRCFGTRLLTLTMQAIPLLLSLVTLLRFPYSEDCL